MGGSLVIALSLRLIWNKKNEEDRAFSKTLKSTILFCCNVST